MQHLTLCLNAVVCDIPSVDSFVYSYKLIWTSISHFFVTLVNNININIKMNTGININNINNINITHTTYVYCI